MLLSLPLFSSSNNINNNNTDEASGHRIHVCSYSTHYSRPSSRLLGYFMAMGEGKKENAEKSQPVEGLRINFFSLFNSMLQFILTR
jgi:hypothetical protein